jgi:outer membrane protein assembly factor BamB
MQKAVILLAFVLAACSQSPAPSTPSAGEVTVIDIKPTSGSILAPETPSEPAAGMTPDSKPTDIAIDETLLTAPSLKWQAPIGEGLAAPAQVMGGRIVVANKDAVLAFDPGTGAEIWRVTPEGGVWPRSLTHDDERIYAGIPGGLLALRASDGQILWQEEMEGEVLWPPLASNSLFVGTAFVGPGITPDPDGKAWIYALDLDTGQQLWAKETGTYTLTTPAGGPGIVYIGGSFLGQEDVEEGGHLRLHAFDSHDGNLHWTADSLDGFLKSLATDGTRLIYLAYSDAVVGLDAFTGEKQWQYPTENWSPGFTFADDRLFFGSDNAFVHAVNSDSGSADWRVPLEGVFNSPRGRPALSGDCLLFQANDNRLYCLHQADGSLVWQTDPQPRSRVALAAGAGHIFLSGQDGNLYAYGAE